MCSFCAGLMRCSLVCNFCGTAWRWPDIWLPCAGVQAQASRGIVSWRDGYDTPFVGSIYVCDDELGRSHGFVLLHPRDSQHLAILQHESGVLMSIILPGISLGLIHSATRRFRVETV